MACSNLPVLAKLFARAKTACVAAGSLAGFVGLNFAQRNQPAAARTTTPTIVAMTPIGALRLAFAFALAGAGAAAFALDAGVGASGGASGDS